MTAQQGQENYPRPDFVRTALRWQSLNGPWKFVFDDEDIGLSHRWAQRGLLHELGVDSKLKDSAASGQREQKSISKKITTGISKLLQEDHAEKNKTVITKREKIIQVPFVFQCPLSGINDRGVHEVLWYERTIADIRTSEEKRQGQSLLLRFGAVDYEARVWINGRYVGSHRGGHVPFSIDVTEAVEACSGDSDKATTHRLTVRVFDSAHDLTQPRGKQYWGAKPESIFYTPSGGIWQSVWLEVVPAVRLADSSGGTIIRSNDVKAGKLSCHLVLIGRRAQREYCVEMEAAFAGKTIATSGRERVPHEKSSLDMELSLRLSQEQLHHLPADLLADAPINDERCWLDGVALWSPEHPQLYDLTVRLLDFKSGSILDEIRTATGMRSIDWNQCDGYWRLNGKPYFQALCLDQGYWPDSFMTPPSFESTRIDIELAKKMGFNGCRKHQKVEDPTFYYWADKLGFLVWAEMASAYQFSPEYVDRFDQEWIESVKLAINHPSVVTWTPANESWGYTSLKDNAEQQNHLRALAYSIKTLDPTRSVNDNCGWEHVCTDLTTFHDYSDGPDLEKICSDTGSILAPKGGKDLFVGSARHRDGNPIMCTEFGGVNIALAPVEGDGKDRTRDWGYTTASDADDLLQRFERLVNAVTKGGHCCAFVYTQLTDIEQEANGLYTFDRKEKLDARKVKAIIEDAVRQYYQNIADL